MLVRSVLGALAGGAMGVVASGVVQGAHAGATGAACALLAAAGAMVATRGFRPSGLGAGAVSAVAVASMLCGMVCSDSRRVLRASDNDVRMALAAQAAAELDVRGELRDEELARLQTAAAPEQLPPSVVLATERAWERMTLTARASFRDQLTAEQRLARGYLSGFGPLSIINGRDLLWGLSGLAVATAMLTVAGRRVPGRMAVPAARAAPMRLKRAA